MCKDEEVSYIQLMDWLEDIVKKEENKQVYYKDIMVLLVNREILFLGLEDRVQLPAYLRENEKIGIS